jgi:hypothetical protein
MAKKTFNYQAPFLIDTVFRDPPEVAPEARRVWKQELAGLWDNVVSLQTYPFMEEEDWLEYKDAPKFLITLNGMGTFVALGSFKETFKLWKDYVKEYYYGEDTDL